MACSQFSAHQKSPRFVRRQRIRAEGPDFLKFRVLMQQNRKKRVTHQIEPHHALRASGGVNVASCILEGSRRYGCVPALHSLCSVVTRVMHEGVATDD